ncbi:hypothetical protein JCGZ_00881 [Jatropha curcas]|uniref:Uncharacterized protein n=1 Tax=Jatropha curcas TaxID=180498 RepID=A0A067L4W2_JATCU|nr:uncharacterized protein LOC105632952 [Jatropha curcas]KDP39124.1 hypothetical protein JCGZ_00881 [Jatropha curcas]
MADIEPPSFSLGFDIEPEPQIPTRQHQNSTFNPAPDVEEEDDLGSRVVDDSGLQVIDSDPESGSGSPLIFKRLRRGPARVKRKDEQTVFGDTCDDDIEDFSSQEDFIRDARPSTQHDFVHSSSKVPLHGCGVLTAQSSNQLKKRKIGQASDPPSSSCLGTSQNGLIFPKLTVSPLRRFQLIDSDSDSEDLPVNKDVSRKTPRTDSFLKDQQRPPSEQKRNPSLEKHQNDDLWKDFCPIKSFHIPTPVLDEVCEEYFQSLRDNNAAQTLGSSLYKGDSVGCHQGTNSITDFEQDCNVAGSLPPAHHYFFHNDPRIQRLVRNRLPNFSPLGVGNKENQQPSESVINYMSQFNGEANKQGQHRRNNKEKGSTRGRNKSKKSNAKEVTHTSQSWVDPRSSGTIPKDAGKRRVHATGQAAGRWFTSSEGKKVYVSKNGQELTGQIAYRNYRKDSGGFRKSKKKTNVKRKKG